MRASVETVLEMAVSSFRPVFFVSFAILGRPLRQKASNRKARRGSQRAQSLARKVSPSGIRTLPETLVSLPQLRRLTYLQLMTHSQLVQKAVQWLRSYRCGVILSEQACASGEMPDAIGWKRACHSVLIECKISRADFLADRDKPFRQKSQLGMGSERFYLTSAGLLQPEELPAGWGLLEYRNRSIVMLRPAARNLRTAAGFRHEMNLLLASLRRVEIRIEPQTLTEFLKWKNRMAEYNGGSMPEGVAQIEEEANPFLEAESLM